LIAIELELIERLEAAGSRSETTPSIMERK